MATRTVEKVGDLDATDHCTEALREVVAAEPRHRRPVPVENEERPAAPAVDLMPTVEKSMREAKEHCGKTLADEAAAGPTVHETPSPKKKTPEKKTASAEKKPRPRRRRAAVSGAGLRW